MKPGPIDLEELLKQFSSEEAAVKFFNDDLQVSARINVSATYLEQLLQRSEQSRAGQLYPQAREKSLEYDLGKLSALADLLGHEELALRALQQVNPPEAEVRRKKKFLAEAQQHYQEKRQSQQQYLRALYDHNYVEEAIAAAQEIAPDGASLTFLVDLAEKYESGKAKISLLIAALQQQQQPATLTKAYNLLLRRQRGEHRYEEAIETVRNVPALKSPLALEMTIKQIKEEGIEYYLQQPDRYHFRQAIRLEERYGTKEAAKDVARQALQVTETRMKNLEERQQKEAKNAHGEYCSRETAAEIGPQDCDCGHDQRQSEYTKRIKEFQHGVQELKEKIEPPSILPPPPLPALPPAPLQEETLESAIDTALHAAREQLPAPEHFTPADERYQTVVLDAGNESRYRYSQLKKIDPEAATRAAVKLRKFFHDYQDQASLGILEEDCGNFKEAIAAFKLSIQEDPKNSGYWLTIAEMEKALGNLPQYQKIWRKSMELFERRGNYERALEAAEKAGLPDKAAHFRRVLDLKKPAPGI